LTEQSDSSVCPDSNFIDGSVAPASDDVQAILAPSLESAQHDFLMRIRELIKAPWWIAAALKGSTSASKWIRNVVLDCVFLLQIDSAAIIKALSHLLDSSQPSTSIAAKIGAACTLGRIGVSASSVVALFKCLCSSGVHDELRKQCMLSLLYISNGLLSDNGEAVGFAVESSGVALNLLLVAAVRFSSDVNRDVSAIARTICQDHVSLLVAFINETQHPHYLAENWLVSGDCACASASAASTILSLQGNESVTEALLHLLRRGDKVASISAASALSTVADPSMRVVQACTEAFLNQHGGGDKHWSAARKVLAKTLCDLVSRGVCPSAIYSMCDVVVNGLEKVLGVSNREEQLREVVMTSTLTDVLRVVSLASQDKSRRYEIVNSESEIRKNDECVTFILRRDVVEAQRLAMHVVGSHAAAHGWTEGLLGIITAGDELQNTIQMYDAALVSLSATAMSDNHDLQPDALATVLTFLKLKAVPAAADAVISWMLERLTRETEVLHDFMNSVPAEARFDRLKKVDKQDFMDFTIKDMFLPPDMQMQSVLVSKWQCDGQGAWLQLLGRCKLVLAALRSDFLGRYAKCLATVFEMCAFALQKLSNCLDMYELPIKRIALVDAVLGYWAAVNSCRFFSECSSCWAVAILSTSTSLTFGTVSPPFIPRFPSLIDERVVDSVKTHLFLVCASVREMRGEKSVESNAFGTFANLKDEFWRITVHLAANDASTLHRAQWLRAAVAIALESGSSDWAAEARGLLLSGLMDPTKAVRQVSAELFSSFKDHRAELVRLLHPYMVSESPDCRLRGIEASLVLYSNPARNADEVRANDIEAYVALLAGMLDDDDVSVRCAVVDALAHVDVQGIHFRKILSMLEDPTVEVRLAAARVVVGRKLKDVGVASVILEAIASRKSRTVNIHLAQLQAVDAISQVGANNPEEWASLLRCIGIALSDSSEDMSTMAFAALAKGAGLNVRSAHAAMDVIPLLNDSVACGPAVQLLGSFCERFCSLPPERCTPSAPATLASHVPSANDIMSRCILHLDARIRPLPAACCRGFSDAAVASKAKQHEALMLWWFCRLQGLVPFSDVDCLNSLQWIDE
jgi:HEAT repeat protein